MGNLCSKSANKPDNFSTPGRTVGASTQSKQTTAPVPQKITSSTPGRPLGGGDGASSADDARSAAARAAEGQKRGSAAFASMLAYHPGEDLELTEVTRSAPRGPARRKKQTQNQLLNSGSEAERRARDADQGAEARNWN
ncbi:hypothetical protein FOPE_09993 [Fonsecaea pedrosoi]|nr:hypothetical protein FOPE_09993 [Fonsecaea pedrosoi]